MIRNYIIAWIIAFILFALVRGLGSIEQGNLRMDLVSSIKIIFSLGPVIGIYSGLIEAWMEERIYKRVPILQFLALRFLQTVLFLFVILISAYLVYRLYFSVEVSLVDFAFEKGSIAVYIYVLSVDLLINIFRQINLMLGNGNLFKLLTGKFYHPREEHRIFMFLDLQSSTRIAEQLGHEKYSNLIQDCFFDLGVVSQDEAKIYQYVGDEAVLTWDYQSGIKNNNFLNAFFRFKSCIQGKSDYYKSTYGLVPFFKAGAHSGKVMVTEIGRYKREIAYHGDTINTASRIQGKCNDLNTDMLISEDLQSTISSDKYIVDNIDTINLRGKKQKVNIYKIDLEVPTLF